MTSFHVAPRSVDRHIVGLRGSSSPAQTVLGFAGSTSTHSHVPARHLVSWQLPALTAVVASVDATVHGGQVNRIGMQRIDRDIGGRCEEWTFRPPGHSGRLGGARTRDHRDKREREHGTECGCATCGRVYGSGMACRAGITRELGGDPSNFR